MKKFLFCALGSLLFAGFINAQAIRSDADIEKLLPRLSNWGSGERTINWGR